jgi:hypothetical protein
MSLMGSSNRHTICKPFFNSNSSPAVDVTKRESKSQLRLSRWKTSARICRAFAGCEIVFAAGTGPPQDGVFQVGRFDVADSIR